MFSRGPIPKCFQGVVYQHFFKGSYTKIFSRGRIPKYFQGVVYQNVFKESNTKIYSRMVRVVFEGVKRGRGGRGEENSGIV